MLFIITVVRQQCSIDPVSDALRRKRKRSHQPRMSAWPALHQERGWKAPAPRQVKREALSPPEDAAPEETGPSESMCERRPRQQPLVCGATEPLQRTLLERRAAKLKGSSGWVDRAGGSKLCGVRGSISPDLRGDE